MADVADQMLAQGFEVASGKPQQAAADGVMGLVQKMQGVATQRAQLEQMKQQMEEAKLTKFVDALDKGKTFKGAARANYYKKFMPAMRDSLGLTDKFPDQTLDFMTADDENLNRLSGVRAALIEGRIDTEEAIGIANDFTKFAQFSGQPPAAWQAPSDEEMELLLKAGEFGKAQKTQVLKTQMTGDAAMGRQQYDTSVKAQEAAAAKVGVDYSKFITAGGMANADEKLRKLEGAAKKLEDGKVETGTTGLSFATAIPFVEAKKVLSRTHPELKALMDDVEGAVNLKQALDSAFSDAAAAQVLSRAFDVNLSPTQNAAKIRSVVNELRSDIKIKMGEFDRSKLLSPEMRSEFMKGNTGGAAPAGKLSNKESQFANVAMKAMQSGKTVNDVAAMLQKQGLNYEQIQRIIQAAGGK